MRADAPPPLEFILASYYPEFSGQCAPKNLKKKGGKDDKKREKKEKTCKKGIHNLGGGRGAGERQNTGFAPLHQPNF